MRKHPCRNIINWKGVLSKKRIKDFYKKSVWPEVIPFEFSQPSSFAKCLYHKAALRLLKNTL